MPERRNSTTARGHGAQEERELLAGDSVADALREWKENQTEDLLTWSFMKSMLTSAALDSRK